MSQPSGQPQPDSDAPTSILGAQVTQPPEAAASQSAPTHFGFVADALTHGTFNYDAGPEYATSEDIAGLHSKLDEMASSGQSSGQSGGSGGGQSQGNANMQGLTPSGTPPRQAPPGRLPPPTQVDFAAIRVNQAAQRQATSASLQGATASLGRRAASWVSPGGMRPASGASSNGMSAGQSDATMAGVLTGGGGTVRRSPTGNGQSESSFQGSRFGAQ